jgi:predicted RNA binding protein YcfA (HicA-like mRNA interferase family)
LCKHGDGSPETEQRALAQYMSYLSQEAHRQPWARGLEYALWEVVLEETREYGRASFGDEHAAALRRLASGRRDRSRVGVALVAPPLVSGKDCVAALGRLGYVQTRQRGSHVRLECAGRSPLTIPMHTELDV